MIRTNDLLTSYKFTQERYCVILTIQRPKRRTRTHKLTDASYARFVALVNDSDHRNRYTITILDEGEMGWRIHRQPILCAHNHYISCPYGCDPNGLNPKEASTHGNPILA